MSTTKNTENRAMEEVGSLASSDIKWVDELADSIMHVTIIPYDSKLSIRRVSCEPGEYLKLRCPLCGEIDGHSQWCEKWE